MKSRARAKVYQFGSLVQIKQQPRDHRDATHQHNAVTGRAPLRMQVAEYKSRQPAVPRHSI